MTRPQSSSRKARGEGRGRGTGSDVTPRGPLRRGREIISNVDLFGFVNKRSGYEISCERRLGTSQAKNALKVSFLTAAYILSPSLSSSYQSSVCVEVVSEQLAWVLILDFPESTEGLLHCYSVFSC